MNVYVRFLYHSLFFFSSLMQSLSIFPSFALSCKQRSLQSATLGINNPLAALAPPLRLI